MLLGDVDTDARRWLRWGHGCEIILVCGVGRPATVRFASGVWGGHQATYELLLKVAGRCPDPANRVPSLRRGPGSSPTQKPGYPKLKRQGRGTSVAACYDKLTVRLNVVAGLWSCHDIVSVLSLRCLRTVASDSMFVQLNFFKISDYQYNWIIFRLRPSRPTACSSRPNRENPE